MCPDGTRTRGCAVAADERTAAIVLRERVEAQREHEAVDEHAETLRGLADA